MVTVELHSVFVSSIKSLTVGKATLDFGDW
jgi:hypothetical protein